MTKVTRGFCWHQNFVPWYCLSLTCGYLLSNDDPGLTLTIFMTGSNLFLMLLYRWQLIEHLVLLYSQVCSNSAYPQHSGEWYRTNGPLVCSIIWQTEDRVPYFEWSWKFNDHRVIMEKVMEYHFVLSVGSLMEPPSLGLTVVPNFDCHDTITIGETPIPILLLSRV